MIQQVINIDQMDQVISLFGNFDENIKMIENHYDVSIINRGTDFKIEGKDKSVSKAGRAIKGILKLINRGEHVNQQNIRYIFTLVDDGVEGELPQLSSDSIYINAKGRPIKPKTFGQKRYVECIKKNTITLGVGPAGTGKTYLAVAMAVAALYAKSVNRIILTRPAVEAGENLGFLPGDLQSKVDPYLRPLYDALYDTLGSEGYNKMIERGSIEIAPLAYMRGRTLDDSFIILDEAQNATPQQMKMFLTRLGFRSKMVITGDITQIDLPLGKKSGLIEAMKVLKDIDDIEVCTFTHRDVVRHRLVQDIVQAYDKFEKTQERKRAKNHG